MVSLLARSGFPHRKRGIQLLWRHTHLRVLDAHVLPRHLVLGFAEQEGVLADLALVHVDVDLAQSRRALDAHVHLFGERGVAEEGVRWNRNQGVV